MVVALVTGPLAQQIAVLEECIETYIADICPSEQQMDAYVNAWRAALSAIERHVQDMETALREIAESEAGGNSYRTQIAFATYLQQTARAALPASGTRNPRNRVAREKGTE